MRFPSRVIRSRHLSRVAIVALLAGLAAGCSDSTMRFSSDPFTNPFNSQSEQTAYNDAPRQNVRTAEPERLRPAPAIQPVASQPLPPVGSVSSQTLPQRTYAARSVDQAVVTGTVSTPDPQIGGFKAGGWSVEGGTSVTARAGETVTTLSNRYGVPSDAIMKVNSLTSRTLTPGQKVIIPVYNAQSRASNDRAGPAPVKVAIEQPYPDDVVPMPVRESVGETGVRPVATRPAAGTVQGGGVHVVVPGETLTSIARAYGTTRPRLARDNSLDEWAIVMIGQKLKVPGGVRAAGVQPVKKQVVKQSFEDSVDTTPPRNVPDTAAETRRTVTPRAAQAEAADTRSAVKPVTSARVVPQTTRPAQAKVAVAQPVQKVTTAQPVKPDAVKTRNSASPVKQAEAKPRPAVDAKTKVEKANAAKATGAQSVQTAQVKPVKGADVPVQTGAISETGTPSSQPAASGKPEFRWPVKGRIIQDFGHNGDGINISVPEGTEIKAAEDGVVAYAGNELKGYGNLVLIRHADGYVTAYGHAKDLDVKKGDVVRRGQKIATVGQTGNVTSPQLLFEVRKGSAPVNPRQYLSGT